MTPRLNLFAAAPAPMQAYVLTINGFNRLSVGFRAVHPVDEIEAA